MIALEETIERVFGKPQWLVHPPVYPEFPPKVYSVCPKCKRLVTQIGSEQQCKEHGPVTPIKSAVVNHYEYQPDWSSA